MPLRPADAVICGAGIAGLAAAWHLAVRAGLRDVVLVDERPPLSLTSDKSTECYRNWWPDAAMVGLMNRSIELLDELAGRSGNAFALNRNGYLYLTADRAGADALAASAERIAALGAGSLRVHRGYLGDPAYAEPDWDHFTPSVDPAKDGADLFLDPVEVRRRFPWAPADTLAALHTRRCGWLSAQQLGMLFLEEARAAGTRLITGRVVEVERAWGRVTGVRIESGGAGGPVELVPTPVFVDAAGPYVDEVAELVGATLPVFHEIHRKVMFDDHLGVVPRDLPLVIWNDPVEFDADVAELAAEADASTPAAPLAPGATAGSETSIAASRAGAARLTPRMPAGVHFRPEGGAASRSVILLWNYHVAPVPRCYPLPEDPLHVPLVVRGIARALPAFAPYVERGRRPYVDGGYYTKTRENLPLIGPLGPVARQRAAGAYVLGALSGFGVMASPAAGELLAAHVTGAPLPPWAAAFLPGRYQDPAYVATLEGRDEGQL